MSTNPTAVRDHIHSMTGSAIENYVIAGLKSELLEQGKVRLFTQQTIQLTTVIPHSHRYNLGFLVLQGQVKNTLWQEAPEDYAGPTYRMQVSKQEFNDMGDYVFTAQRQARYRIINNFHKSGEFYYMDATEIHSIVFEAQTQVLVFEGPERFDCSVILEPMSDHGAIPLCQTLPWMFKRV